MMSSVHTVSSGYYEDHHDITVPGSLYLSTALSLVFPEVEFSLSHHGNDIPTNMANLLHCPWCCSQPTMIDRKGERNDFRFLYCCSSLYCYNCNARWYVCADCSVSEIYPLLHGKGGNSRTACHMRKKRFEEHVKWHKNNISINQGAHAAGGNNDCVPEDEGDEFVVDYDGDERMSHSDDVHLGHNPVGCCINHIRSVFNNAETCHIGEFMIHELKGQASRHIIQESINGSSLSTSSKEISNNDSLLFMLLLSLGSRMSREERNKLVLMLSLHHRKVEEDTLIAQGLLSSGSVSIPMPTTSYEMRKIFEAGKQQFTNYLPMPVITSPIPGYASISLIKTLQIIYSRNTGWDNDYSLIHSMDNDMDKTWRSILVGDLAKRAMHTIANNIPEDERDASVLQPILLWSDSADLNKVKNNRSSIKVHNVYVAHRDGQSPYCVFPLAIGSGKSSHNSYRTTMFQEINLLHGAPVTCYDSKLNQTCLVRFFVLAVVQDRPEHSEFTGTIAHNGKFGALPGYSFPRCICVGSLPGVTTLKNLSSCSECYKRRTDNLQQQGLPEIPLDLETSCENCYDWDFTKLRFKTPTKMPRDIPRHCFPATENGTEIMTSKKVSFDSLKEALQYIHEKTYKKEWTDYSKTVLSYASYECLNTAVAKKVYNNAKDLRKKHIREEGQIRNDPGPVENEMLPTAMLCSTLSLDQCMVGIMHTLFLNGGKKFLTLIQDVFKKEKMGTLFLTRSKRYFRDVRTLSLSWIMAWPFGSTNDKPMAPWVSENFVAYYQISKSHTSLVCERLILKGGKEVADNLKFTVSIWHRLLSIVMQPESPSSGDIIMVGELAKLFLSRYHDMEKYVGRSCKDWDIQNASCLLMLLLLPEYMKKFGCLRNYWEGGHMGERSITKLKKSLPHGAHMDGSVRTAIRRYFVDVVLSQLMEREQIATSQQSDLPKYTESDQYDAIDEEDTPFETVLNSNENCTALNYDRYRRFRVYQSVQSVQNAIVDLRPIAMVFLRRTNNFYVILWKNVNRNRYRSMHKVKVGDGEIVEGTYMISKELLLQEFNDREDENVDVEQHVLFDHTVARESIACAGLPYHVITNDQENGLETCHYYYIRTENHTELRMMMHGNIPVFSYPSLHKTNMIN